jgi:hypothetical protein
MIYCEMFGFLASHLVFGVNKPKLTVGLGIDIFALQNFVIVNYQEILYA